MVNKNRVMLSVVGAVIVGSGIFCNFAFADNPQESEFSVTIAASETLVIPDSPVNLVVTPNANGVFSSGSFNVTAYTNNPDGYYVTMTTNNTALTSNTANVNTGTFPTIATLSANATESTFELNKWGISLDGGENYLPMVASKEVMNEDEATSAQGDVQAIGYATKLDLATVPGTYSTTIGFTITPKVVQPENPVPPSIHDDSTNYPADSLLRAYEVAYTNAHKPMYIETDDLTNYPIGWKPMEDGDTGDVRFAMQDIDMTITEDGETKTVCEWAEPSWANFTYVTSSTPYHYEMTTNYIDRALVMDLRDGKSYWVIKHADGKCWMAQNLDFDFQQGVALTSETTALYQINDSFNLYNSSNGYSQSSGIISWTPTGGTLTPDGNNEISTPSGYVYATPYAIDPGTWYWRNDPWHTSDGYNYGSQGFLNNFSSTSFGNPDPRDGTETHIGNYYNWGAAAATNNGAIDRTSYSTKDNLANDPQNSICPKGWRLPKVNLVDQRGDEDPDTLGFQTSNDFYALFVAYGLVNGTFNEYGIMNNSQNESNNDKIAVMAPFYFTRAGEGSYNTAYDTDDHGNYWTSTLAGDGACLQGEGNCAATFRIRSGFIEHFSTADHMNDAHFSIRCIAR